MALDLNNLKTKFFTETGLEWSANIHAFIQYYQAQILEKIMEQQQDLMTALIQKVDNLDDGVTS